MTSPQAERVDQEIQRINHSMNVLQQQLAIMQQKIDLFTRQMASVSRINRKRAQRMSGN